ncbi:hypothetical protein FLB_10630 [Flavobacterium succinicans]|uniref:Uncharacterized protein n=1 Tax=Flavobacterium succinicans TaxID=29536 RepID=A0A199XTH7_9FLAO|nr:hypothetical protein FLB_10630 [Flavobacterium succinicans]
MISSFTCPGSSVGTLLPGVAASGVTQIISANVDAVGSYSLSTNTVNGVTFTGSDTFSSTGNSQSITLTATGIPLASGTFTYTLNACSFTITVGCPGIITGRLVDTPIGAVKTFSINAPVAGNLILFSNQMAYNDDKIKSIFSQMFLDGAPTTFSENGIPGHSVENRYQSIPNYTTVPVTAGNHTVTIKANADVLGLSGHTIEYMFVPDCLPSANKITSGKIIGTDYTSQFSALSNPLPAFNLTFTNPGKLILLPTLCFASRAYPSSPGFSQASYTYDIMVNNTKVGNALQSYANRESRWQMLPGLAVADIPAGNSAVNLVPLAGSGSTLFNDPNDRVLSARLNWIYVPATATVTTGILSAAEGQLAASTSSQSFTLIAPSKGKFVLLGQASLWQNSVAAGLEYKVKNGLTDLAVVNLNTWHPEGVWQTLPFATELSVAGAGPVTIDYVPTPGKFISFGQCKLLWIFIAE